MHEMRTVEVNTEECDAIRLVVGRDTFTLPVSSVANLVIPKTRLSDDAVFNIRRRHYWKGWTNGAQARAYDVSRRTIQRIIHGDSRQAVPFPDHDGNPIPMEEFFEVYGKDS